MKTRKTKELLNTLLRKGFSLETQKSHHKCLVLIIDGRKQHIHTYFSHGKKEYDKTLMSQVKKQLKFDDSQKAEDFFDCPLSFEDYVKMLKDNGQL